jgi:hypothetical protein
MPSSETTVAVDVRQIPRIDYPGGMRLAETENGRVTSAPPLPLPKGEGTINR